LVLARALETRPNVTALKAIAVPESTDLIKPEVFREPARATPKKDGVFARFAAGPGITSVVSEGAPAQTGITVQYLPGRR
jgi:hypothetical protein